MRGASSFIQPPRFLYCKMVWPISGMLRFDWLKVKIRGSCGFDGSLPHGHQVGPRPDEWPFETRRQGPTALVLGDAELRGLWVDTEQLRGSFYANGSLIRSPAHALMSGSAVLQAGLQCRTL